jgi:hypothetical protein
MSINETTPQDWDALRTAKDFATVVEARKPVADNVNHPPHYNIGKIECIDYLEDNLGEGFEYYLEGNVKKYLHRFRHKGNDITDLRKARWYLDKLITTIVKVDS